MNAINKSGVMLEQSKFNNLVVSTSIATTVDELKSWLTSQNTAGTPVTVQYKLATPTVTDLTYQELQMEYPLTNIYTTSTVKPKIIGQVINN